MFSELHLDGNALLVESHRAEILTLLAKNRVEPYFCRKNILFYSAIIDEIVDHCRIRQGRGIA